MPVGARAVMEFSSLKERFRAHQKGSVAVMSGLVFSVVSAASLFAIDHVMVTQKQVSLQSAVDQAALTTVRGLRFVRDSSATAKTAQGEQPDHVLTSTADAVIRNLLEKEDVKLETNASRTEKDSVRIVATLAVETPFGSITGLGGVPISAEAEAQLYGARNICVMALGDGDQVGINLENQAQIKAGDCGLYSNSKAVSSVNALGDSFIDSSFVCAAGGYTGTKSNVSSTVLTDCPQVEDPLKSRPLPDAPTACTYTDQKTIGNGAVETLYPGHYCGGLSIEGDAVVEMKEGDYHISGGLFIVQHNAQLTGNGVSIIMEDQAGNIFFNDNAKVTLSAPTDGLMAGIVIASRSVCGGSDCHFRLFEIKSTQVSSLLGTIYIPEDRFIIKTNTPISEEAAFTIILSRYVQGQSSPTLVLNTDYEATDVPVPDGFAGSEGSRLIN